jgi:hypothetical protein
MSTWKSKPTLTFWPLVFLLGNHTVARADILVLDLNFSSEEVRTIRAQAEKRIPPEKVIVLPVVPWEVREQMGRLRQNEKNPANLKKLIETGKKYPFNSGDLDRAIAENTISSIHISGHSDGPSFSGYTTPNFEVSTLDQLYERRERLAKTKWEGAKADLESAQVNLRSAFEARAELLSDRNEAQKLYDKTSAETRELEDNLSQLNSKTLKSKKKIRDLEGKLKRLKITLNSDRLDLENAAKSLDEKNKEIRLLTLEFSSAKKEFDQASQKKEAAESTPSKRSHLESVYLWGCYSNTPEQTLWWKKEFPQLNMIAGFDGTAPLGTTQVARDLLGSLMEDEPAISSACTNQQLKSLLHSPQIQGFGNTNAAIAILNENYCGISSRNMGTRTFDEIEDACTQVEPQFIKGLSLFGKYWLAAEPGYASPPRQTGSGTPIREFYNLVQRNQHCSKIFETVNPDEVPTPSAIRSILFFETFKKNFGKHHASLITHTNEILAAAGIPKSQHFPMPEELTNISRKELLERLHGFTLNGTLLGDIPEQDIFWELTDRATAAFIALECYDDISWIEESDATGSTLTAPSC